MLKVKVFLTYQIKQITNNLPTVEKVTIGTKFSPILLQQYYLPTTITKLRLRTFGDIIFGTNGLPHSLTFLQLYSNCIIGNFVPLLPPTLQTLVVFSKVRTFKTINNTTNTTNCTTNSASPAQTNS